MIPLTVSEFSYKNRPKPNLDNAGPKPAPYKQQEQQGLSFLELKQKQLKEQKKSQQAIDSNRSFWKKEEEKKIWNSQNLAKKVSENQNLPRKATQSPNLAKEQETYQSTNLVKEPGHNDLYLAKESQKIGSPNLTQNSLSKNWQSSSFNCEQKQNCFIQKKEESKTFSSGHGQVYLSKEEIYSARGDDEFEKLLLKQEQTSSGGKCEEKEFERLYSKNFEEEDKEEKTWKNPQIKKMIG